MRSRIMPVALLTLTAALAGTVADRAHAAKADTARQPPIGHRQPSAEDVQGLPDEPQTSADSAMKKLDQELDRKLKSICRGC